MSISDKSFNKEELLVEFRLPRFAQEEEEQKEEDEEEEEAENRKLASCYTLAGIGSVCGILGAGRIWCSVTGFRGFRALRVRIQSVLLQALRLAA